jgi:hypothetical protein
VGMFEWFCFQKFCGWHCNPSWKGVVKDILTHTWAQLVCQLYVIRATRGFFDEVDWSTHTLFSERTVCRSLLISISFGYHVTNL